MKQFVAKLPQRCYVKQVGAYFGFLFHFMLPDTVRIRRRVNLPKYRLRCIQPKPFKMVPTGIPHTVFFQMQFEAQIWKELSDQA